MKLKVRISDSNERLGNRSSMQQEKEQFIGAVRKFMETQTLTVSLLRELIDPTLMFMKPRVK